MTRVGKDGDGRGFDPAWRPTRARARCRPRASTCSSESLAATRCARRRPGGFDQSFGATTEDAAMELVPRDVFETLEILLGDAVDAAPRCSVAMDPDDVAVAHRDVGSGLSIRRDAGSCAARAAAARRYEAVVARARATFHQAKVRVQRMTRRPVEKEVGNGVGDGDGEVSGAGAASGGASAPSTTRSGRTSKPTTPWWEASEGSRRTKPAVARKVGRAVSLVVNHDYTASRVKFIITEKMGIHPLDQKLYFFDSGEEHRRRNGRRRASASKALPEVRPESTIALVATNEHDPDDLTGLEMPLGPARWQDEVLGGEAAVRGMTPTKATERGFAGTGLHGSDP